MTDGTSRSVADAAQLRNQALRFVGVSLTASSLLAALKIGVGLYSGSQALLVSALYSINDVLSSVAVAVGLRMGYRRPSADHPYGFGKAEFVAVGIVSVVVAISSLFLVGYSLLGLFKGVEGPPHFVAIPLAAVSAVVCWIMARRASRLAVALDSPALETSGEHYHSDASGSAAAIVGIAGAMVGLHVLDPIVAIVEEVHLLALSATLLSQSTCGLMDAAVPRDDVASIERACRELGGGRRLLSIRSRRLGSRAWVDVAMTVPADTRVGQAHELRQRIERTVRELLGPLAVAQVRLQGPRLEVEPPGPGGSPHA